MEVDKILSFINSYLNRLKAEDRGELSEFAKRCRLSQKNMADFSNKYGPGSNPQFRTTYKVLWGILGRPPVTIEPAAVDPLLAARLKRIQGGPWAEFLDLVVNVLADAEYADPMDLAEIKGELKAAWRTVVSRRDQPPGAPGERLSNSPED